MVGLLLVPFGCGALILLLVLVSTSVTLVNAVIVFAMVWSVPAFGGGLCLWAAFTGKKNPDEGVVKEGFARILLIIFGFFIIVGGYAYLFVGLQGR